MLSETSQSQKGNTGDSTYTKSLEWSDPYRQKVEWWVSMAGGEELLFKGD